MAHRTKRKKSRYITVTDSSDEDEALMGLALDFFKKINNLREEDYSTVVRISTPNAQGIKTMDVICDICKSPDLPCNCMKGLVTLDNQVKEVEDSQHDDIMENNPSSSKKDLQEAENVDSKNSEDNKLQDNTLSDDNNDELSNDSIELTELIQDTELNTPNHHKDDKEYLDIPSDDDDSYAEEHSYAKRDTTTKDLSTDNKEELSLTFSSNKNVTENVPTTSSKKHIEHNEINPSSGLIFDEELIGATTPKILQNMSGKNNDIPYADHPTLAFLSAQIITSYALSEKRFQMLEEQNVNSLSLFTTLNDNVVLMLQHLMVMDGKINSLTNQVNDLDGRIKSLLSSLCIYEEKRSEGIRKTGVEVFSKTTNYGVEKDDLVDYLIKIAPLSVRENFKQQHAKIMSQILKDTDDNLINWLESINLKVDSSKKAIKEMKSNPKKDKYKKTLISIILAYVKYLMKEGDRDEHSNKKKSAIGKREDNKPSTSAHTGSTYQTMMNLWDSHKNKSLSNDPDNHQAKGGSEKFQSSNKLYGNVDEDDW